MNIILSILLSLSLIGDVRADEFANQAEYERISIEMEKMRKNGIWAGVDKRFREIEDLDVEIKFDHYVLGAQASQELGNILECKLRLEKALEIKPKRRQVRQWYTTIENDYGFVVLSSSSKKEAVLERKEIIVDPIKNQAITFAQDHLEKKGKFDGMLPIGNYNFSGQDFLVSSGIPVQLDISPRMRRLELNKKLKEEEKGE